MLIRRLKRTIKLLRHFTLWDALKLSCLGLGTGRSPICVNVGGVLLRVRPIRADLEVAVSSLVNGEYDSIDISEVAVVVDAGANIGTSSIAFSRRHPNAIVIAIEPESENYALLVANTRSWPNIHPVKAALTSQSCSREIVDKGSGPWGYSVSAEGKGTGQLVDCVSLPDIMRRFNITHVDILKLDIEGGEKEVLDNSEAWIGSIGSIVAEPHDWAVPGCSESFRQATKDFPRRSTNGEKMVAYR